MKRIRGLHGALLPLLVVVVIGVVGCGENTEQPLLETASAVPSSPQTTFSQAIQMPDGTMQPGGTMMGMGGMMHRDGNMPMGDDPMEQNGIEQMPEVDAQDMGQMMEEMDAHHRTMSDAMKTVHDAHHQKPAAQPQPVGQVPAEHNQHHQ